MPAKDITIDANGQGFWHAPRKLKWLTLQNRNATNIQFRNNTWTDFVNLPANTEVEFEPEEAGEIEQLSFLGIATQIVEVVWA